MAQRIVLIAEKLLANRYGASGADTIVKAARPFATARVMRSKEVTAIGLRADLQPALAQFPDAVVLLIGGVSSLPFFDLTPNPAADADLTVLSDNPYGVPGAGTDIRDLYLPRVAVGRIPDHPDDTASTFSDRIQRLCLVTSATRNASDSYTLSTVSWKSTSESIARSAGLDVAVDLAPPRTPTQFSSGLAPVSPATSHYLFNLHGSDRTTPWYGETADGSSQPAAFDVASVDQLRSRTLVKDRVFFSQACYGAYLRTRGGDRTPSNGLSLKLLEDGASAFVGSTTIAYGMSTGMSCSDVLAAEFMKCVCQGSSFGSALQQARRAVAQTGANPPAGALLKTLLQFVLYGDPAAVWSTPSSPVAKSSSQIPDLGKYDAWVPGTVEPKTLVLDELLHDVSTDENVRWTPLGHFDAAPPRRNTGLIGKGSGSRRDVMMAVRSSVFSDGQPEPLAYFRERIRYSDGSVLDAQSTGGIAVRTILERPAPTPPLGLTGLARATRPVKRNQAKRPPTDAMRQAGRAGDYRLGRPPASKHRAVKAVAKPAAKKGSKRKAKRARMKR